MMNGFITLSNSHTPAWDNARASNLRHGGAVPFMYLDQDKHFQGGIDSEWPQWPESYPVNSLYGIPSSDEEGIFSIISVKSLCELNVPVGLFGLATKTILVSSFM